MRVGERLHNAFYKGCRDLTALTLGPILGLRTFNLPGLSQVPGGLLIVANHQSFLDPLVVGCSVDGAISYLARRSLFAVPGFGALLRAVRVHPISRGEVDSAALKTVIRILRGGGKLLMFPEGTRSRDGALGRFKPGAAAIAVRCRVPMLPLCIEGTYRCWPRTRLLPRPGRVAVAGGCLVETEGIAPDELTRRLRAQIEELQRFLRRMLEPAEGRPDGSFAGRSVAAGLWPPAGRLPREKASV